MIIDMSRILMGTAIRVIIVLRICSMTLSILIVAVVIRSRTSKHVIDVDLLMFYDSILYYLVVYFMR